MPVRETSVSRYHGVQVRARLKLPVHHITIVLGASKVPPLCREMPASRTAGVFFSRLGSCSSQINIILLSIII